MLSWIFDIGMFINVLALLPQPITTFCSKSAKDVSLGMWWLFFVLQTAMSLHGNLNLSSRSMFLGMGGSALVSLAMIIMCYKYEPLKRAFFTCSCPYHFMMRLYVLMGVSFSGSGILALFFARESPTNLYPMIILGFIMPPLAWLLMNKRFKKSGCLATIKEEGE